jgi:ActR/RegA family two-component response regulator
MMMAYDSSQNPPSRLDDETVAAVRDALRVYLSRSPDAEGLRRALTRMSTQARERSILPEHVLVVLKDVWSHLPEVRAMPETGEQIRMLQRVVTMCIKEYYSV